MLFGRVCPLLGCGALAALALSQTMLAATLCVNPGGSHSCFNTIQKAVNAASPYDTINVAEGTYKEDVVIGKPLSLIGAGAQFTTIDAKGLSNGIFVDGYDHAGLSGVVIDGFTVENAQFEGVLVVSASDVTIRDNTIVNNDKIGPMFGSGPACPGQPAFETDESGDCGGGLHFIGTSHSTVSNNLLTGNGDGFLISDETAESHDNVVTYNVASDNPPECGIVLASHPPVGSSAPYYAPHYGVNHNTISQNISSRNGVTVGGAGIGLFSDGNGPGRVSGNVIIGNQLIGNGIPGVSLHSHVGPAFGAPADDMDGNMIIGNYIAGNGADTDDTATAGPTGIIISSGGGGSPVKGTIISQNVITDEQIGVAISTPAEVDVHLNNLLVSTAGVANVCGYEKGASCSLVIIDATQNFWGCPSGPGSHGCSAVSGADIRWTPWLTSPTSPFSGFPW